MTQRQLKTGYFLLTAVSTIATTYFFDYLFFFLHDRFAFGNRQNLWVSALHGFVYIFSAWQCGRFAQRRGFITSLKIGFIGLLAVMIAGAMLTNLPAMIALIIVYSVVLLFIWPALEALVSENETQAGVQRYVGAYNCIWAGAAAFAYFSGGPLYDWSPAATIFWIPAAGFLLQYLYVLWLARHAANVVTVKAEAAAPAPPHPEPIAFRQPVRPETFLKMAWLANPFAYVAINTLWAVMPGVAAKLHLSPTKVGLFCSVWLFARLAAFFVLWRWNGWHYRFRWLLTSFVLLIASFGTMLVAGHLWIVVSAQIIFGLAVGLIYYSSLFYSMDIGAASAEHGGLHEAAIGAGIFGGPAVGALALQYLPTHPDAGVLAVSGLLVCGLAGLIWLRVRK
jgi:predicted MFS family arabinose efflux permease